MTDGTRKMVYGMKKNFNLKDFAVKMVVQLIAALIAFLPAIFFFTVKALLSPTGFWQNFAVYGLGAWFLGGLQIIFLATLVYASLSIWE